MWRPETSPTEKEITLESGALDRSAILTYVLMDVKENDIIDRGQMHNKH